MRIVNFIAKKSGLGKSHAKALLASHEVFLNHSLVTDGAVPVAKFDHLMAGSEIFQSREPRYILLHKPVGVVSATTDPNYSTVIDLIKTAYAHDLHLAGRLDRASTGLMILTNNSKFSESITRPENKIPKRYLIETDVPITEEAIEKFRTGMRFDKEKIRTAPAMFFGITPTSCRLTIYEGKHHQIKRMFLRFDIRVVTLHREAIGSIELPPALKSGQWMELPDAPKQLLEFGDCSAPMSS
ncbi:MAG: pseudouridine synthase [Armatimonadetes bacterium]|nr:pseudouridine synthase [Akkermansiaceae bacterium]